MMGQPHSQDKFPWDIGVFDAHCHPTDTMSSIAAIPRMKAATLTVMSTRGEDQDLVFRTANKLAGDCTDTEDPRILPCFGWHPWFSHQIIDDTAAKSEARKDFSSAAEVKNAHYRRVLKPSPDENFISSLPDPKPLSHFLSETRARLLEFPTALVGEIGLDRAFRLPQAWTQEDIETRDGQMTPGSREGRRLSPHQVRPEHQRAILEAQLRLAGELRRPVSVHSVQGHGAVIELFKSLWSGHERKVASRRERKRRHSAADAHAGSDAEDGEQDHALESNDGRESLPFPPRICMHSYSGPVETLKQFLHPSNPSNVYFSFSSVINFAHQSDKSVAVIKALPDDRVLIESDLHIAGEEMDERLEEAARQVCKIRGWDLRQGVQRLADNWRQFVYG
ncbi:TatD family hydrolase [Aspergillus lucknowensis]|uniref:Cut9 interacting protein Scn1 n=1 Tax=Aspergillus lucknowensis TaxID=176173 RepID=A0ABR4M3C5_9EURO